MGNRFACVPLFRTKYALSLTGPHSRIELRSLPYHFLIASSKKSVNGTWAFDLGIVCKPSYGYPVFKVRQFWSWVLDTCSYWGSGLDHGKRNSFSPQLSRCCTIIFLPSSRKTLPKYKHPYFQLAKGSIGKQLQEISPIYSLAEHKWRTFISKISGN